MPSVIVKNLPSTITTLTDKQLFEKLRSYNINVGPVLPTTREVYQRKLYALETGQQVQAYSDFAPADSDDQEEGYDDEPMVRRAPDPPQPRQRTTITERQEEQAERRRDFGKPSPRKPLHPEIGDYSRSRSPVTAKRAPAATKSKSATPAAASTKRLIPVPVLAVVIVVIIAIFVFFIFKNMESEPVSNIPDEIEMNV